MLKSAVMLCFPGCLVLVAVNVSKLQDIILVRWITCYTNLSVSCEDGSFSSTSTRLCLLYLYQQLWVFCLFCGLWGEGVSFLTLIAFCRLMQMCHTTDFKEITCLSDFTFLLNCVMGGNGKFHFVKLFPPVEHIIIGWDYSELSLLRCFYKTRNSWFLFSF